ncbi:S1C family serine protease [Naumannella halotolerans]|uniref:S1C family serine protease n=1 Tax=Naumannella halotolerans TaxID=993414 RepID=UPI0014152EFA|nr:trypsin-like peptidase domain-containing protein [Naumannella halotolerans]
MNDQNASAPRDPANQGSNSAAGSEFPHHPAQGASAAGHGSAYPGPQWQAASMPPASGSRSAGHGHSAGAGAGADDPSSAAGAYAASGWANGPSGYANPGYTNTGYPNSGYKNLGYAATDGFPGRPAGGSGQQQPPMGQGASAGQSGPYLASGWTADTDPRATATAQPGPTGRPDRSRRARRIGVALVCAFVLLIGGLGLSGTALSYFGLGNGQEQADAPASGQDSGTGQGTEDSGTGGSSGSGTGDSGSGVPGQGMPGQGQGGQGQGGQGMPGAGQGPGQTSPGQGSSDSSGGTEADEDLTTSVVLIETELESGTGAGTGMVLSSDGTILTNYHVVDGSTEVQVTVADTGQTYEGTVLGSDESADVAVVKIDATGLTPITVDDDGTTLGEELTAVGNALGGGELLQVSGELTGTDESIQVSDEATGGTKQLTGLLETDAAVVSGYSGGPMFDDEGEVIGISTAGSATNSQVSMRTGSDSYAVPIDEATEIADQILAGEEGNGVTIGPSGFLGIAVDTSGQVAEIVEDSPAEDAGIEVGSEITSVNGTSIDSENSIGVVLGETEPGEQVRVRWTDASGESHSAEITLAESPTN